MNESMCSPGRDRYGEPGSAKWIRWQGGLADMLSLRYRITGEMADLDDAIAQLRAALRRRNRGRWVGRWRSFIWPAP